MVKLAYSAYSNDHILPAKVLLVKQSNVESQTYGKESEDREDPCHCIERCCDRICHVRVRDRSQEEVGENVGGSKFGLGAFVE